MRHYRNGIYALYIFSLSFMPVNKSSNKLPNYNHIQNKNHNYICIRVYLYYLITKKNQY